MGQQWFLVLLMGALFVWSAVSAPMGLGLSIAAGLFLLLGLYLVAASGAVSVDGEGIVFRNSFGRFGMSWSEVDRVEVDSQHLALAFCGQNKCLPLPGPGFWSGEHAEEAFRRMAAQVEDHQIPTVHTQRALYRRARNTRLSS